MYLTNTLETVQFAVSWALCSMIWLIQLMQYPAFRFVEAGRFAAFHRRHTLAVIIVIVPLMLAELAVTAGLLLVPPLNVQAGVNAVIVAGIWASTFFVQVPLHRKLALGKDEACIEKLLRSNWLRTGLWSLKAVLASWNYLRTL